MYKNEELCIKSDFKDIFLKLATNGQSDEALLLTSGFCPQRLSAPALGLYTCIKSLKMCKIRVQESKLLY